MRSPSWLREVARLGVVMGIVTCARISLADHYLVPSGSMEPTVMTRDHVVVDKLAYGLHLPLLGGYALHFAPPERGDVVVLESPEDGRVLLKRVVAVPGDEVSVVGGTLVIDGRAVPVDARELEPVERLGGATHRISLAYGGGPDFGPLHVPAGRFLVLGDNRGNSRDGRWFGLVARDAVLGRVEGVIVRDGHLGWVRMR
jgi:signal peptidase I